MNRDRFPGLRDGWARLDGAGRHADGRQRDRGDGRLDALGPRWPTTAARSRPAHETDELVDEHARGRARRCSAATPRASSSARA